MGYIDLLMGAPDSTRRRLWLSGTLFVMAAGLAAGLSRSRGDARIVRPEGWSITFERPVGYSTAPRHEGYPDSYCYASLNQQGVPVTLCIRRFPLDLEPEMDAEGFLRGLFPGPIKPRPARLAGKDALEWYNRAGGSIRRVAFFPPGQAYAVQLDVSDAPLDDEVRFVFESFCDDVRLKEADVPPSP
jgi:hypothetical protein